MKVFVTGGNGFIGSVIVSQLIEMDHDLRVYDIIEPTGEGQGEYIKGDILDHGLLSESMRGYDCVIHMVGLPDARVANERPNLSFDLNVRSNQALFEAARQTGVPKVIVPSSASVYGVASRVPTPEDATPNPTNVYSSHKLIAEHLAQCYSNNYGMDVAALRLFNVYGPQGKGILNLLVNNAKKGDTTKLFGEKQKRDFVHVTDIAQAFSRVLEAGVKGYQVYNVGTGQGKSIQNLVEIVREYLPELKVEYGLFEGAQYDSVADLTRIQKAVGFVPSDSEARLRSTVRDILGKVTAYA